ncbi:unnamed protein product [Nippostrongylus brasiliensis]|uniref:Ovule protein n=1 Tax=Nippostrongylus brasiliensis TaxID=27835 RepID=A0A0N4YU04_NIPBR|nr:unnamed protein product [Nippostrongylus brasiliensis]
MYRIELALLRTSPRSCSWYVESEFYLTHGIIACPKHVPVPSRTGFTKLFSDWDHSKTFPYIGVGYMI